MSDQLELFELPERGDPGSIALAEILDSFELVAAENGPNPYMVVADKSTQLAETVMSMPEIGYSSPSPFTSWTREEWNPKLRDKMGITEYYRMKRLDGIVRGALRVFKTPVLSAHWFMKPGSDSVRDQNASKFVEGNLLCEMTSSWRSVLDNILLMCDYGYMAFEKVWELQTDGKIHLRKLAPRHPSDIQSFLYDGNGGPNGILMEPMSNIGQVDPMGNTGIPIPISKLVIFSLEPEAGDLQGISILRSAYKHYQYKDTLYKIDAIQKERHGIGVPVIKLPPGWKTDDKQLAEQIGRNLRTNERSHITLPPQWDIMFAKLEGQPVDCMKSIEHHNEMIMVNVLAPFLTSPSVRKESLETFYKGTRYIADNVSDCMNRWVVRDLIDMNYTRVKYPELKAKRIGEWEDARVQSFTLRNYVGAGLIVPDQTLEKYLRDENDLPEIDFDTRMPFQIGGHEDPNANVDPSTGQVIPPGGSPNAVKPPQAPQAGLPRQAPPSPGTPQRNGGNDRSGGK